LRLVTYQDLYQTRLGALAGEWVIDLEKACRVTGFCGAMNHSLSKMQQFLAVPERHAAVERAVRFFADRLQGNNSGNGGAGVICRIAEVNLLAPVQRPRKILCLGMNYPPRAAAVAENKPAYPLLFERNADSLIGPGQPILLPAEAQEVVPEGELVVVMGRQGKHIPPEKALDYVGGYTIANDVTALDLERRASQWTTGKLADAFLPVGTALVTPDEVPDPEALTITTRVNGQLYQQGSTAEMHYGIREVIAYISARITLYPGDLLLTGSPKYQAEKPLPQVFLQDGDVVQVEIQDLGALQNPVRLETA
jgi:acylpyruvate hydrolase